MVRVLQLQFAADPPAPRVQRPVAGMVASIETAVGPAAWAQAVVAARRNRWVTPLSAAPMWAPSGGSWAMAASAWAGGTIP
jgi:hypothetical protein